MNKLTVFLAVTTVFFGATTVGIWKRFQAQREQIQSLQMRVQELQHATALRELSFDPDPAAESDLELDPDPAAPPQLTEVVSPLPAITPEGTAVSTAAGNGRREWREDRRRRLGLLSDPEYRAARKQQVKESMKRNNADLAQAIGLSEETAEELFDLFAEHALQRMQMQGMPGENGETRESARARYENLRREHEAELERFLGSEKYGQLKDYQDTLPHRRTVERLAESLKGSADPLREDQVPLLVSALAAEHNRVSADMKSFWDAQPRRSRPQSPAEQIARMEALVEYEERVVNGRRDAVAPYLSAAQLERFDDQLRRSLEMRRRELEWMRRNLGNDQRYAVGAQSND